MELKQIASFAVDHTKLVPGIYISRTDRGVDTYDLRLKKPNATCAAASFPIISFISDQWAAEPAFIFS